MTETTAKTGMVPCAHCAAQSPGGDLIDVAGYPLCRVCLERIAAEVQPKGRRLMRIRDGRMMTGVCGGLAEQVGMDRDVFRVIWVLVTFFTGIFPGLIVYLVLSFALSQEP